jgi:integrase
MEYVQPIRDKKKIQQVKAILKGQNCRDYALFTLGINSGLRVSDLLSLKVSDVLDDKGKIKDRITLREKKTGKVKDFPVGETAKKALREYLGEKNLNKEDYLFPSRKKGNGPITRIQAYRILNKAARLAGIEERIGTHTLRKTFGYHAYKMGLDLSVIQKLLNHSSPAVTLAYIGITQDDLDNVYMSLNL